ncbi:cysteine-rich receptor-like protein kinase 44 [Miscanthus floridulus]|uniref:cysteine-rich receptor-like protein kinase 44 n=1 Tax=Miscanthus floridulus TaxID=154761 RepID=UPI00345B405F
MSGMVAAACRFSVVAVGAFLSVDDAAYVAAMAEALMHWDGRGLPAAWQCLVNGCVLGGMHYGRALASVGSPTTTNTRSSLLSTLPKDIPASFLKQITSDFSPKRELGKGAFGTVYTGIAENGEMIVVKKLGENCPVAHDKTFSNEVCNLMAAQHENIVKLVGYCHESHKKVVQHNGRYIIVDIAEVFLCYEYLPKGSLDKYLFAESNRIDWDTRFRVVQGICKGLYFLHKEMDQPVVHMDLKPENILLDDNMVPKIANFGLSRLFGQEQTRMNTQNIVGSFGYMAPEYLYTGEISTQSDIYSFGLLIIQISTGEKNIHNAEDKCGQKFIDIRLQQIKMCVEIGLQCVEHERKMRPSIVDIVQKLNGMRG